MILSVKSEDDIVDFSYSLPDNVNVDGIEATCKKGVLEIIIPKKKQHSKLIEIK